VRAGAAKSVACLTSIKTRYNFPLAPDPSRSSTMTLTKLALSNPLAVVVDGNNQARQLSVTVGAGQGGDIEVLGEVAPGDRVVIRVNERLQPGQAVNVMDS
jgi:hypothetical protein